MAMEKGSVTGAVAVLVMATVGAVVSASTQLSCAPPPASSCSRAVPLGGIDAQPVFQLHLDYPLREPGAVSGRHPLGCVPGQTSTGSPPNQRS